MICSEVKKLKLGANVTGTDVSCKKRTLALCFAFLSVFFIIPSAVTAQTTLTGSVMAADDRATMLKALTAIRKGQWQSAENLTAQTRDPLAAKLYYWMAYTKNPGEASFSRIAGFVEQNPDWPWQTKLQKNAESALDGQTDAGEIIRWFSVHPPFTTDAALRYFEALALRGQTQKLQKEVRGWWSDALMSGSDQDHFFSKYSKILDEKSHQRRLAHLLAAKHYTNARKVARVLGKGYPALAEARIAIASNSGGVDRKIAAVPPYLANDPGLAYERLRWRRKHNKDFGALEILHNPPPADLITNMPDWWKERHVMARRFMEKGEFESAYMLVSKHQQKEGFSFAQAEFLAGWLALKIGQPWRAFEHFEALYHRVATPISKARGAYWAGRASEALGHPEIARQWYLVAARHQSAFYGQLALAELPEEYKPPQIKPPARTLQAQNSFNRMEMVQAARLLHKAGMRKETSAFLDALAEEIDSPEEYILLADLAAQLDHYHNAVRIAKKGLNKNIFMMEQAYPTMLARMKNVDQEWALVHAIIRQESAFDYDAQSPAGARGLMQLMPATAKETAHKKGLRYDRRWLTTRPDYNIQLGAAYMQQMIDRYDGSYLLAAAAYNGGPGRVDQWLKQFGDPRKGEIDIIDWAELIPVYETRNYVQRVLEGVYVYRIKLRGLQKNTEVPIHVALRKAK